MTFAFWTALRLYKEAEAIGFDQELCNEGTVQATGEPSILNDMECSHVPSCVPASSLEKIYAIF